MKLWIAAPAALALMTSPALAQDSHAGHEMHGPAPQPALSPPPTTQQSTQPEHADHAAQMEHWSEDVDPMVMRLHVESALGEYSRRRDASGTSWQPDASPHGGGHDMAGPWMVMSHLMLNGVYDWQDGPRGDEKAFVSGMAMIQAAREVGDGGALQLRAMVSPDPLMGSNGYPLLFAAGESANGVGPLVDRQHPHDLFMELSASYSQRISDQLSVFVYGGLPGEPAFGPPAFMHRMSAMDSPEAPITHHWFDSTHITFGVLTGGIVVGDWKFEASQFRGREPDEDRYDIESGDLDSTALRLSWNPTENLSLQASWADVESPEALEPDEHEERWSVSGIYTRPIGEHGWWSTTLAFSNKGRSDGASLDAWLAEAAWHPNDQWTIFARGEAIETDELGAVPHGPIEDVQRISLGVIRDFRINDTTVFGVGALVQQDFASDALEPLYDGDPQGGMAFVRLKIG